MLVITSRFYFVIFSEPPSPPLPVPDDFVVQSNIDSDDISESEIRNIVLEGTPGFIG